MLSADSSHGAAQAAIAAISPAILVLLYLMHERLVWFTVLGIPQLGTCAVHSPLCAPHLARCAAGYALVEYAAVLVTILHPNIIFSQTGLELVIASPLFSPERKGV